VPKHGSDLWVRCPGMRKLEAAEMAQAVRRVEARLALAVGGLEAEVTRRAIISLVIEVRAQGSPRFFGLITTYLPSCFHVAISSIGRTGRSTQMRLPVLIWVTNTAFLSKSK
jgi:hypothetical protein